MPAVISHKLKLLLPLLPIVFCSLVLFGWHFDIYGLRRLGTTPVPMNPMTAILFIILGINLFALNRPTKNFKFHAFSLALLWLGIGGLTLKLSDLFLGTSWSIDGLLYHRLLATEPMSPNRMAPNAVFNLFFLSLATLLLHYRSKYKVFIAQVLAGSAAFTALFALIGYAYHVQAFYGFKAFTPMALSTAIFCMMIACSALYVRPQEGFMRFISGDSPSGRMAKILLPASVLIPFCLGWLRLEGQRQGFYDLEFGTALLVALNILTLFVPILISAYLLHGAHQKASAAIEALRQEEVERATLLAMIENSANWTGAEVPQANLTDRNILRNETAANLQLLANSLPQLVWVADATGWINWYNDRWYEYTGTTLQDMEGWGWQSVHDPNTLPAVMEKWQASIATGKPFEMVFPLKGKDGIFRQFLTRINPITDPDGKLIKWFGTNPEAMRPAVIGTTTLEHFTPEEAEGFLKNDREALKTGLSEVFEKVSFPNGETRHLFTKKVGFSDAKGDRYILGLARDITALAQAEEERKKLLDQLMQSNTNLERFAYVASHDMQEPLRMIGNFSRLIGEEYNDKLDETGQLYIGLVKDSAVRMQDMVQDLLEYARVKNDTARFVKVDAELELKHVLDNFSSAISEADAKITHGSLPHFMGNPVQFMRLLQNLIGNGLKYQAEGNQASIHIDAADDGSHWRFAVKDNGIGINPEFMKEVFEPFKRLHSWNEYKGSGIGLAVCKQIVESHEGSLSHDLSAPLRAVVEFSRLLKEEQANVLNDDGKLYLSLILESGYKMQAMLAGLLDYSRLSGMPKIAAVVDCNEVLKSCQAILKEKLQATEAILKIDPLPQVVANDKQIKQLFLALLDNALKFHMPGVKPHIKIWAEEQANAWLFKIRDSGIGIEPAFHQKIFKIFQRLHSDEEYPGIGIGLALAEKIVGEHGGTIGVESSINLGATFFFTIPIE